MIRFVSEATAHVPQIICIPTEKETGKYVYSS